MGLRGCSSDVSSSAESSHKLLDRFEIAHHQREGFVRAPLASAQLRHRSLVGGIAGQQKPAQALDRHDLSLSQQRPRLANDAKRVCPGKRSLRTGFHQGQRRSTNGARIGLGMEAPVAGIFIFRLAIRAHHEGRHGGGRAIIGYVADDGVARAAMGAIGEGISVAPVRGIAKITPASIASAGVGRDQSKFTRLLPAVKNREPFASLDCDFGDGDLGNLRQRGRIFFERPEKAFEFRSAAFDLDGYARR